MSSTINRRNFLQITGKGSALLLSTVFLPSRVLAAVAANPASSFAPNIFVRIDAQGLITVICHLSEMGQRVRTSVAQVIADELEADWSRVKVEQAVGDAKYGTQNTDGSRSIRHNLTRLREAGAAGRMLLEQAAAQRWSVPASECKAQQHEVIHSASGRRLAYGALVADAAKLSAPATETIVLKGRQDWRYIGKAVRSLDDLGMVTGRNVFGQDVQLEGMKYAVIARPPVVLGKAKRFNAAKALAVPGVLKVFELPAAQRPVQFFPLGGIAVVATNTWAAIKGREALEIEWDDGENGSYDSKAFRTAMEAAVKQPGSIVREEGDVDTAFAAASQRIAADYYTPHLAHATMEPPAATAVPRGKGFEIWACSQDPQAVQNSVGNFLKVDPADVIAHVTFLGGGFGRKSKADFSVEAAWIARAIDGPVKVIWTREDEIQHGYYHAASAQHFEASLDRQGVVTGVLARSTFPSILSIFAPEAETPASFELDLGFKDNAYHVPNLRLETAPTHAYVRIGWLRSVCNVFHAFAAQSFVHELAVAAAKDPKDFLLELIGPDRVIDLSRTIDPYFNYEDPIDKYPVDTSRLRHVTEEAAKLAQWGRSLKPGRGLGIAAHRSFLTYVATVVEVEVSAKGDLQVIGMWTAADAGTIVNLDAVTAQYEGGGIFGISCALGAITASAGRIDQSNFHDYRVARMSDTPLKVHVKVIESTALPAGVGEPATPPAAPALCNAIYAACGKRIRELPIGDQLKT